MSCRLVYQMEPSVVLYMFLLCLFVTIKFEKSIAFADKWELIEYQGLLNGETAINWSVMQACLPKEPCVVLYMFSLFLFFFFLTIRLERSITFADKWKLIEYQGLMNGKTAVNWSVMQACLPKEPCVVLYMFSLCLFWQKYWEEYCFCK